jgi:HEAT repeat protein
METIPDLRHHLRRLASPDWRERLAASEALSLAGNAAVPALIAGLSDRRVVVRAACAALMDHLADARCAPPLRSALNDPSPTVRRHAVHAIGCQRCKRAPLPLDTTGLLIERALSDPSLRVRRVAAHQLGLQPSDPRAAAALRTILERDDDPGLLSRARFARDSHSPGSI